MPFPYLKRPRFVFTTTLPQQGGVYDVFHRPRKGMFPMVERIRAQWIFTGDQWDLSDHILWLRFVTRKDQA